MKNSKPFLFGAAVLLFATCGQPLADSSERAGETRLSSVLDAYFQKIMDSTGLPGLAVAVVRGDSILYARGFGVKNLETQAPLQTNSIFHLASVSKPFAATAVVQLMERGKIDLDERLTTYLPYFKLADARYRDITIRQMLNHTSGMPDEDDYEWEKPQFDEGAAERYVRSLADEKLISTPGAEFHYSNIAFDVLADVVAKVSGEPFETFVKKEILLPLEMRESSFYQPETNAALRTSPHVGAPPAVSAVYPYNRRHAPSSTLNSSVIEMSNWLVANLNQGVFRGKSLLKPESHALLMTPSFVLDNAEVDAVGLSWFLMLYQGNRIITHNGSDPGYRSHVALLPDKKIGVVLLANANPAPLGQINARVLDILLEEKF